MPDKRPRENVPLLLELGRPETEEVAEWGGKAAGLTRLIRAGLPVPHGAVLHVEAFHTFLTGANVEAELAALAGSPDPIALAHNATTLRARLLSAPIPPALKETVSAFLERTNPSQGWAVRSSATAEDLEGASFAGQQDTFLGVNGADAVLDAARACFASLFSDRACAYRASRGISPREVAMAVVIQEQLNPESAGVVFTVDPSDKTRVSLVLEAVPGLGEALVSGRMAPERWRITRHGRRILQREPVFESDGTERPSSLSEEAVKEVVAQALRAEDAASGVPQDVEWAIEKGKVWLLQSRAITVLPPAPTVEEVQVWTNMNTGEVMPDVITPFTWSFLEVTLLSWFTDLLSWLGLDVRTNPLISRIGGRAYFNLNTCVGILKSMPVVRNVDIEQVFGGLHESLSSSGGDEVLQTHYAKVDLSLGRMVWRVIGFGFWYLRQSRARSERAAKLLATKTEEALSKDVTQLSDEALSREVLASLASRPERVGDLMGYAVVGMSSFSNLATLLSRWFPEDPSPMNGLLAGLGGMASAEAALSLWRLSEEMADVPALASRLSSGTWEQIRPDLEQMPQAQSFLAHFDEFMRVHGHHTRGEIELFNPRWAETPDLVLGLIRSYGASSGRATPLTVQAKARLAREVQTENYRRKLSAPKRLLFDYLLRHARGGVAYRENVKSDMVRATYAVRKRLLEVGKRLTARGTLTEPSDVFFLSLNELETLLQSATSAPVGSTVTERREQYELDCRRQPPPVVVGRYQEREEPRKEGNAKSFRGLAVSPGVAEGPARVVLRADSEVQVLAGEVLVAPFTDPGWSPYFLTASAIVMDMGGLLSHGSIVARECGIPAVVNVGPATRMIRTGEWVRVDGLRGEVTVLGPRAEERSAAPAATRLVTG